MKVNESVDPATEDCTAEPPLYPMTGFALVQSHHRRLDGARLRDDRHQRIGFARENGVYLSCDAVEERTARGHAVFDHFVESRPELATRQRLQQGGIDGDHRRMVERSDQVLAERMVDAHFAADRAVDLRQERGRHLHQWQTAQVPSGNEASHIADDASAHRNNSGTAVGFQFDQRFVRARDRRELLMALAVGKQNRLCFRECLCERLAVELPHERTRDEKAARRAKRRLGKNLSEIRRQSEFDADGIGARTGDDVDFDHG